MKVPKFLRQEYLLLLEYFPNLQDHDSTILKSPLQHIINDIDSVL